MKLNFKKILKRTLIGTGITLLVLILAALLIPLLFKKQLVEFAKRKINESIYAKVDFQDVDLSMIWTFPNFEFSLKGLTVDGIGQFEGVRMANIKSVDFTLDLWSVWNMGEQPLEIRSFFINEPDLYLKVLADGKANYDISIPDTTSTSSSGSMEMKLRRYGITKANIIYDNDATDTYFETKGFTHTGSGDFTETVYDLNTNTHADTLTVGQSGINYLTRVALDAKVTVNADMGAMKYTLKDNNIKINELDLKWDGWVATPNEKDVTMDLTFGVAQTSFASLLSLIPAAYTSDYKNVKTDGQVAFNGFVKGTSNETETPAFAVNLSVDNGSFQYPGLPMSVNSIALRMAVNSPTKDLDNLTVDVSKFHMALGANPFDAHFVLKTPMSDPQIDGAVKGTINLAEFQKAFPLPSIKELSGIITADVRANTRMSYIEKEEYEKVDMGGKFNINNLRYATSDQPLIWIKSMNADLTPNNVNLTNLDMVAGKSDFKASGKLDNLLTWFSRDKTMKGSLVMTSNVLDVNEWMSPEPTPAETKGKVGGKPKAEAETNGEVFNKFDFSADVSFNLIKYETYTLVGTKAKGSFTPKLAKMTNFETRVGASDLKIAGEMQNWWGYLFGDEKIVGKFSLNSQNLDLNPFMASDGAAQPKAGAAAPAEASSTEPISIPANVDFVFDANIGHLQYSVYDLRNAKGELVVRNQKVLFNDLSANTLGGSFVLNGSYETKDPKKPGFSLGLKVNKFQFAEVAKTVETVKKYAPIVENMEGIFNTTFNVSGTLLPSLMPDLGTLTADGLMETIDATINNFKPLQSIGEKTGIQELRAVSLKNTVNFFTIKDGKLEVKPFDFKFGDIVVNAGGYHGLNTDMNYNFVFNVPKDKLTGNAAGAAANQLMNTFSSEAAAKGINLGTSDVVKFTVVMTGSMLSPKLAIKFLDAGTAKAIKDQVVDAAKAELEKKKAELEAKAHEEVDKYKAEAEAKAKAQADKLKAEAEAKAKAELEKAAGGKVNDVIKNLPNPFGKKGGG